MKKTLLALASALFITLAPVGASANHEEQCFPIAQAKVEVAKWDKNAIWEYLTSGPKYDAIVAWAKVQNKSLDKIDGILVTSATASDGSKMVFFAFSANGQCVEMSTFQKLTPAQFASIVGKEI